jgi:ubiquinone/menaquinone biosynthesis C-methylase UbiE
MVQKPENKNAVSYYDIIAEEYDSILGKTDARARNKVKQKFTSVTPAGIVLDFGGGTGLDLHWLADFHTKVYFCEPSEGMRSYALKRAQKLGIETKVQFLKADENNFKNWKQLHPIPEKIDAVLANFAVVNCIDDINLMFENLASVLKPGGNLIALVLENRIKKILKKNPVSVLKHRLLNKPLVASALYKGYSHTAHIYSNKSLLASSQKYFEWISQDYLDEDRFSLIHLKRK